MDKLCAICCGEAEKSFDNDSKPISFNDFFKSLPQPQTYSSESCGNAAYDCPTQVPFISNPNPCYNQDLDNNFPQTLPNFQQQFLCCDNCGGPHATFCGGPHATFECQPMNQDFPCYNSLSLDQYQPLQYLIVHQPSEEKSITEIVEDHSKGMQTMMLKMFEIHWQKQAEQREEEKRSAEEQAAQVSPQYWKPPISYDDDEECSIQMRYYYKNSPIAIASDSPIMDSLITEDEHLDTIPEMESDEVIKSSVEDLVQTPSESEDLSNNENSNDDYSSSDDESFSEEDVPVENFKIYSNPLLEFDEEIFSNTVITSPKIDFLFEEFAGELALIKPIPPEITETNFDPKEDIRLIKKLLYDNSSPRPPEELNSKISDAIIKSFSPSPIPVEDSDSLMEEIDIFLAQDDSIPPGIENDDYD
ncbi:hypothetical protein Tco_0291724 [Tanacetum coccineum]